MPKPTLVLNTPAYAPEGAHYLQVTFPDGVRLLLRVSPDAIVVEGSFQESAPVASFSWNNMPFLFEGYAKRARIAVCAKRAQTVGELREVAHLMAVYA